MAWVHHFLLGVLLTSHIVQGAPSDIALEDNANSENPEPRIDNVPNSEHQREKRQYFYNYPGIGPSSYLNFENVFETPGSYGFGAPFYRQPAYRPPQNPVPYAIPFYIPILYVPSNGCSCPPNNNNNPNTGNVPVAPTTAPVTPGSNNTDDGLGNRFSGDNNLNWGLNPRDDNSGGGGDYSERPVNLIPSAYPGINNNVPSNSLPDNDDNLRPISLRPANNLGMNAPPLDHGSTQAGRTPMPQLLPTTFRPSTPFPVTEDPLLDVGPCDKAAVSCCHSKEVTYQCFIEQGCTNYGWNPCDPKVITRSLNKLLALYASQSQ